MFTRSPAKAPPAPTPPLKLYIGTGVQGIRPAGYTTVDIDPENHPDIVADARSLPMIKSGSVEELHASHILEHFAWPQALEPLAEWWRVLRLGGTLKIAVPDMALLGALIARGENPWIVMTSVYGAHWLTPGGPQGHHFGWTYPMLTEVLHILGFGDFRHWSSELPEAANGWLYFGNGERIALSLNVAATKLRDPVIDPADLQHAIRNVILKSLSEFVDDLTGGKLHSTPSEDPIYAQKLHLRLIEETIKNRSLQSEVERLKLELKR
jgi:hypothetical protein